MLRHKSEYEGRSRLSATVPRASISSRDLAIEDSLREAGILSELCTKGPHENSKSTNLDGLDIVALTRTINDIMVFSELFSSSPAAEIALHQKRKNATAGTVSAVSDKTSEAVELVYGRWLGHCGAVSFLQIAVWTAHDKVIPFGLICISSSLRNAVDFVSLPYFRGCRRWIPVNMSKGLRGA